MSEADRREALLQIDGLRDEMYRAAFAVALDVQAGRTPDVAAVGRFAGADAAYQAAASALWPADA